MLQAIAEQESFATIEQLASRDQLELVTSAPSTPLLTATAVDPKMQSPSPSEMRGWFSGKQAAPEETQGTELRAEQLAGGSADTEVAEMKGLLEDAQAKIKVLEEQLSREGCLVSLPLRVLADTHELYGSNAETVHACAQRRMNTAQALVLTGAIDVTHLDKLTLQVCWPVTHYIAN